MQRLNLHENRSRNETKGCTAKRTGKKPHQQQTNQPIMDRNQMLVSDHATNMHGANGEKPRYIVAMKHNKPNYKATKSDHFNQAH